MVLEKFDSQGIYEFLLTNRQGTDDGKRNIAEAFGQIGLPVRSNIS
jgi:hypothetical protein